MFDWFDAMPQSISTYGGQLDDLLRLIVWIVGPWFVLAEVLLIYFLFRFRKRDGVRAIWLPADTLKVNAWILVPCALVLACDLVIEAASDSVWHEIMIHTPENTPPMVRITGQQYNWTFRYPGADEVFDTSDDIVSIGEMHVPVDEPVRFALQAKDVLHAFWVPELRFKQDAVPGRSFDRWFEATRTGRYDIGCAELCGAGHTSMAAELIVESRADFNKWIANNGKVAQR